MAKGQTYKKEKKKPKKVRWYFLSLFLTKKFIVLINHPGSTDPTPDYEVHTKVDELCTNLHY